MYESNSPKATTLETTTLEATSLEATLLATSLEATSLGATSSESAVSFDLDASSLEASDDLEIDATSDENASGKTTSRESNFPEVTSTRRPIEATLFQREAYTLEAASLEGTSPRRSRRSLERIETPNQRTDSVPTQRCTRHMTDYRPKLRRHWMVALLICCRSTSRESYYTVYRCSGRPLCPI